ncbi:MAG TPA: nitronate monooxygenase [Rhodothermia bacterium]|nr:nitronate monooxygenase [Rhodothermia bacterium]
MTTGATKVILPKIIQGGMGIGVSNWELARAVASRGQMGVVSGTALDSVLARRLQLGDESGDLRRALSQFPWPAMARRVRDRYFIPGGKLPGVPFRKNSMVSERLSPDVAELLIVANFVEVYLAKEGHEGLVGINYLEKVQRPTLPSLLGAMLARVDAILMGAGIPLAIPGILDKLAKWEEVELKLTVIENPDVRSVTQSFNPSSFLEGPPFELKRPLFFAIISSETLAKTFERRASGFTDGFIVENYTAGGHNAPPRRDRNAPTEPNQYGPKDVPDLAAIAEIGRPFWLAGSYASPERLGEALESGATGVQLGSIFALSDESGIMPSLKRRLIDEYLDGDLKIRTDFEASPTGFPFKIAELEGTVGDPTGLDGRSRICDMGYLREMLVSSEGKTTYRCAAEPVADFVRKGGPAEATEKRVCLCNGLMATIGLGQIRADGPELPLVTAGDDFSFLHGVLRKGKSSYTASEAIDYIVGVDRGTIGSNGSDSRKMTRRVVPK